MLGRLVLEQENGSREVLSEVWSDKPLDAQGLVNTITARVSAGQPGGAQSKQAPIAPVER